MLFALLESPSCVRFLGVDFIIFRPILGRYWILRNFVIWNYFWLFFIKIVKFWLWIDISNFNEILISDLGWRRVFHFPFQNSFNWANPTSHTSFYINISLTKPFFWLFKVSILICDLGIDLFWSICDVAKVVIIHRKISQIWP